MAILGKAISLTKPNYIGIEDDKRYYIAGVQNYGKGVVIRREVMGFELTMKKYQVIKKNQLMWCKVDTKNGAFGITHEQHAGALASTNMMLATINEKQYLPRFIETLFRLKPFYDWITKYSSGSTNRKYLTPKELLEKVEIPDLTLSEQISFQKRVDFFEKNCFEIELTHQQELLKKLRQQILQEAIEGKLTADWRVQNPDVEPASELLKRIAAEKEQLIKDKKIKAQKPLSPITDEEKPLELPQSWEWCRIDDMLENKIHALKAGPFGSSLTKTMYCSSGYKVYGQEQVIKQDPNYGDYYVNQEKYDELYSCKVAPGDILISLVGTIGKLLILPARIEQGVINPRLIKISLHKSIYAMYFDKLYSSNIVQEQLKDNASGQTMDVISIKILKCSSSDLI